MSNWENPGYPIEYHKVITEDKYILTLTRVRNLPKDTETHPEDDQEIQTRVSKPAVLLVHGLFSEADHWFINSSERVLPYRLVNEGYDCWLSNNRGSPLSKGHAEIPKESKSSKFWNFSWQDVAHFDIPAVIDYILKTTGNENLSYVGHSMGCLVLVTGLSFRPEYCPKIKVMIALAPSFYGGHIRNKAIRLAIPFGKLLGNCSCIANREGCGRRATGMINLFLPWSRCFPKFGVRVCKALGILMGVLGNDQIEDDQFPILFSRSPASTSIKLYFHWLQSFESGKIRQYDYGRSTNLRKYGQESPPEYDFTKANIPVAIFYSDDDAICPPEDVIQLSKELPNLIGTYQISQPQFTHCDFLFGKDVNNLVFDRTIEIIRDANKTTNADTGDVKL